MRNINNTPSWKSLACGIALLALAPNDVLGAGSGFLRVTSNPDGAEILVEGQSRGKAPLTIELSAGNYEVTARKQFYVEQKKSVSISEDVVSRIEITLNRQPGWQEKPTEGVAMPQQVGTLTIIADIDGAEIYVDGVKTTHGTPNTLEQVPAGNHNVRVSLRGMEETKQVLVAPNRVNKVAFSLLPIQQSLEQRAEQARQQQLAEEAARKPANVVVVVRTDAESKRALERYKTSGGTVRVEFIDEGFYRSNASARSLAGLHINGYGGTDRAALSPGRYVVRISWAASYLRTTLFEQSWHSLFDKTHDSLAITVSPGKDLRVEISTSYRGDTPAISANVEPVP